jgi:hypothetical protein
LVKEKGEKILKPKGPSIDIIASETYNWLGKKSDEQGKSLRRYLNDLLDMVVEREDFLAQVFPKLKKIGFTDGYLYIKDDKITGVATIGLDENNFVHCQLCKKMDCVHVLYSMAMIEVTRLAPLRKGK